MKNAKLGDIMNKYALNVPIVELVAINPRRGNGVKKMNIRKDLTLRWSQCYRQYKKKGYKKKSVLKSELVPELSNVITQQNG